MSRSEDRPTRFFSVGRPYVAERHGETVHPYVADPPAEADVATSWVVLDARSRPFQFCRRSWFSPVPGLTAAWRP
jgi:hypothetical protein